MSTHKVNKRKNKSETSDFSKKKRYITEDNLLEEEQRLKQLVFGNDSNIIEQLEENIPLKDENADSGVDIVEEEDSTPTSSKSPAWVDEDEQHLSINHKKIGTEGNYASQLRDQFIKLNGTPKWAQLNLKIKDSDEDSDEDELLQTCSKYLSTKQTILRRETIDTKQLPDLNIQTRKEGPIITSVEFHPTSSVGLVAGHSGLASIFQVDGITNPKLQSIHFQRFPISCSRFTPNGNAFIVGSKQCSYFHLFDMIEGKTIKIITPHQLGITNTKLFDLSPDGSIISLASRFGNIHLINSLNNETISSFKMNGDVTALNFSQDGSRLYSYSDGGEVYVWDMNTRTCRHRFQDEGSISGRSIATSPNGQYLACGSDQGVVNIYTRDNLNESQRYPQPCKTIYNLTTPVTCLRFNATSEILGMTSSFKEGSVRLAHFPSMTIFKNFPIENFKIARSPTLAFSPNSGFLSIGTNTQSAKLFRLKHYGNY